MAEAYSNHQKGNKRIPAAPLDKSAYLQGLISGVIFGLVGIRRKVPETSGKVVAPDPISPAQS
jgi:hypothetical protein